ncbi:hypothetical protein QR685DRAFT_515033 [Neurospora intermedia]|uniref:Uncharacterized protein n=1 Tax=Neurospora intermedia TaxID=5142 RepID=A0ABR3DJ90_NEUIN
MDDKPKVYGSRGVSDLIKLFESQSQEMKTRNDKVQRAVSLSPSKKQKTATKEAQTTAKKAAETQSHPQCVFRPPHVHQVYEIDGSEYRPHKGPQSAASESPKRSLQSQPKVASAPSVGGVPNASSKPCLERPSEPSNNNNVAQQAKTEKNVSATVPGFEEKLLEPEPKRGLEKEKETSISVGQGGREGMKNLPTPKPLNKDLPSTQTANKHEQPSDPRINPTKSDCEGTARFQHNSNTKATPQALPKKEKLPTATSPKPAPRPTSPMPQPLHHRLSSKDTKELRAGIFSLTNSPSSAWQEHPSSREPHRPVREVRVKDTLINSSSLAGKCGSTPALTNASILTNNSVNSMKVEYNPSDRSTTTVDSMKVEPSLSDINGGECGSTVSNMSIGSMVVEVESIDQPTTMEPSSEASRGWGCGTTPGLPVASGVSVTSVDSMNVEYSSSEQLSSASIDSIKVEYSPSDQLSSVSVDSMNVEYSPNAQSELWEDILQRLGVEAEKET